MKSDCINSTSVKCSEEFKYETIEKFMRRVWVKRIMAINCERCVSIKVHRNCFQFTVDLLLHFSFLHLEIFHAIMNLISSATCKAKVKCQFHFMLFLIVKIFIFSSSSFKFMYRSCKTTTVLRFI